MSRKNWNAPWALVDLDMLGRTEYDKELSRRLVPFWKRLGLRFLDLIGTSHAWCMLRVNYALDKVGVKGTGSAGASSAKKFGAQCPYWFGAILPITHKNGKHHVNIFLYWEDEGKRIAVTVDGNKNNTNGVFLSDISGRGDSVVPSPRWPVGMPDGMFVSKAEVLAEYPMLVPKGFGSSTR